MIIVSTGIGFSLANRCNERPRQIRQIISCVGSLKAYINYVSLPLSEALIKCTYGTHGAIAELFKRTAAIIEENGWMTPQEAIEQAIKENNELVLEKPELEVLAAFGANLGLTNREEQSTYLNLVQDQFIKIEADALKLRDQNSKMYRYLGICGGLAVVILLI